MSMRLMVRVLEEANLSRPQQAVLVAMAESANDDGSRCFPSVDRIAWRAGYSARQVVRVIRELRTMQVIEVVADANQHRPTEYHIHVDNAPSKLTFEEWQEANGRHTERTKREPVSASMSPLDDADRDNGTVHVTPDDGSDVISGVTPETLAEARGDISDPSGVTPVSPDPVLNPVQENDIGSAGAEPRPTRVGPESGLRDRFDRFWASYPRRVRKQRAWRWWQAHRPDEALTERMLEAIALQCQSPAWRKDGGAFIPHPSTWLGGGGWEDELGPAVLAEDHAYITAFGETNIDQLADWLDRLDSRFAGAGWVRATLRKLAVEVPGLSPPQLKAGMSIGYDRIEARIRDRSKPVTNPTTLALLMFRDALDEQRVTT